MKKIAIIEHLEDIESSLHQAIGDLERYKRFYANHLRGDKPHFLEQAIRLANMAANAIEESKSYLKD